MRTRALLFILTAASAAGQQRPNIVLMFPDNLGWGEVGVYGSVRGVPDAPPRQTRRRGHPAQQLQRRVLLHGLARRAPDRPVRHPHAARRSARGITLWEVTIAEALKSIGYSTGALRQVAPRRRRTGGEARAHRIRASTSSTASRAPATRPRRRHRQRLPDHDAKSSFIWEGKAGEPSRNVKLFDLDTRRTSTARPPSAASPSWSATSKSSKPFFLYYPMTQIHFPTLTHPDFAGKTGAGDIGDAMADVDHNVGLCSTPSTSSASRGTPSCSGAPTTAPSRGGPGAGRPDPGAGSTTRSWKAASARPA